MYTLTIVDFWKQTLKFSINVNLYINILNNSGSIIFY